MAHTQYFAKLFYYSFELWSSQALGEVLLTIPELEETAGVNVQGQMTDFSSKLPDHTSYP